MKYINISSLPLLGAVYVFLSNDGVTWSEENKLLAADGAAGDHFGSAVCVYENIIAIGAPHDDNTKGTDAG